MAMKSGGFFSRCTSLYFCSAPSASIPASFLFISAFALLTYGVDIVLLNIFRSQDINLKIECFHWFGLAIVLISVSFIGGNISSIRRELSVSRKKLQSSLKVIREMAIHDDLTGFYNRSHLMDLIESENIVPYAPGLFFLWL